jgi:hypothetical protein
MAAGAAVGAAVAAQQAKLREEEERLTGYSDQDLHGWEFKIVRSAGKITGERLRQLCQEEAENGWELLEKFDDQRVRFKRPLKMREKDGYSEIDPYRTQFGLTETKLALIIIGVVFAFFAAIIVLGITLGAR